MPQGKGRPLADSRWTILSIQTAMVVGALLLWEWMTKEQLLNPLFFGQPTTIAAYAIEALMDGSLLRAAGITVLETLYGFATGMLLGTALGLGLWWSVSVARVLEPLLVLFNAIPKVTLAPILIVLLGVGLWMKVALAFLNVVILAALTAYLGAKQADPDFMDLVRSVGGSTWQVFYRVVLPSAFPGIISSMKIGTSLAFIGAVVGEFLAAREGLGYLAIYGSNIFNMSLIMVAVLGLLLLALALFAAVRTFEDWLLGWRPRVEF
ncbi:MAG: ABC transporter permease subunit [Candidatus Rokubacteria bacterium]|nr:ABC transporter permease subunit [Candidatus Rokubacteria bacterium]